MSDAREWLDDPMNVILDPQSARSALLAVLDLHREQIGLDDALRYCYDCEEGWPCATARAIDKAIGVTR